MEPVLDIGREDALAGVAGSDSGAGSIDSGQLPSLGHDGSVIVPQYDASGFAPDAGAQGDGGEDSDGGGDNPLAKYGLTPFLLGDGLKLFLAGASLPLAWKGVGRFGGGRSAGAATASVHRRSRELTKP